ncbi:cysteine desulfurase NifS [Geopsychrobacter electrodiphilus]|uniref:cysteine desulfurase NifS n=1 Tax=Geopsychrobacter electrodiphilus TaxID=225196 RepID=UPI00036AAD1F|nr:cysteine desulfurase NifS [Geopsychrobacter electrodiphilus]
MNQIYLDHNATTPVSPAVLAQMLPFFSQHFGNPSSVHWAGRAVSGALETARERVAALINASPNEIVFTSCGSEADNLAIKGTALAHQDRGRHIITTVVEHPAVLESCRFLERQGWRVSYLPVDSEGALNLDLLEESITAQTVLISVMWANNETGNLFPIAKIGEIARRHNICFHSDMVQAVGRTALDVKAAGLDLAAISGHKFGAPKGVGALYVRAETRLEALIHGGHQERHRRGGTSNVAGIIGLGAASEIVSRDLDQSIDQLKRLRDRLEDGLFSALTGIHLNGSVDRRQRLPNTLNLSFAGVAGESLLLNLDLKGIAVSSGSACSSGTLEPSHVIAALGVDPTLAQSSLRFSFGLENTEAEVDYVLEQLPPIVQRLRKMSPLI